MKKYIAFVLVFLLALCSCSQNVEEDTFDILCELLAYSGENREEAALYSSSADIGEFGYIDDGIKTTLYGERCDKDYFPLVEEYSICLFERQAGEVALFKCYSRSDTDTIAQMCLERADLIKVMLNGTEHEEKSRAIRIEIHGRYVLFSFSDHSDKIAEYFVELV